MVLVAVACGSDGDDETALDPTPTTAPTTAPEGGDDGAAGPDAASADRTVEVDMADNTFNPANLSVAAGETVQFVFTNSGAVAHDAFVGDTAAQAEHEAEMQEAPEGEHEVAGEAQTHVMPGDEGEIVYTFGDTGTLEIGCHQPDHYLGGMKMAVTVS